MPFSWECTWDCQIYKTDHGPCKMMSAYPAPDHNCLSVLLRLCFMYRQNYCQYCGTYYKVVGQEQICGYSSSDPEMQRREEEEDKRRSLETERWWAMVQALPNQSSPPSVRVAHSPTEVTPLKIKEPKPFKTRTYKGTSSKVVGTELTWGYSGNYLVQTGTRNIVQYEDVYNDSSSGSEDDENGEDQHQQP